MTLTVADVQRAKAIGLALLAWSWPMAPEQARAYEVLRARRRPPTPWRRAIGRRQLVDRLWRGELEYRGRNARNARDFGPIPPDADFGFVLARSMQMWRRAVEKLYDAQSPIVARFATLKKGPK